MSRSGDLADEVYESVRALAHGVPASSPAPEVYVVLGNLKLAGGQVLADVLDHSARALRRSLNECDVYDRAGDPRDNAETAARCMENAARLARQVGDQLEKAQCAISLQG